MIDVSLLIGGEARAASGGRVFDRYNPVTNEIASRAPAATVSDAFDAPIGRALSRHRFRRRRKGWRFQKASNYSDKVETSPAAPMNGGVIRGGTASAESPAAIAKLLLAPITHELSAVSCQSQPPKCPLDERALSRA